MKQYYFTSEAVSCGHPDKICDQISDAILDEFLKQDPESKVTCEAFITNNLLVIGGEAHTEATVDIVGTAKSVLESIGYNGNNGFNPETAVFVNTLHEQSSDIRQGVDKANAEEQGAGDQGIMFGYACNETKELMPLPAVLANAIMRAYDAYRDSDKSVRGHMGPDAKCQCTVLYEDGKPKSVDTIVLSMQHADTTTDEYIKVLAGAIFTQVFLGTEYTKYWDINKVKLFVNPTGRFVIGGPEGDTGLTGRKIIVDTYGGKCPHGGGAFSGKDPSKVDRSAAYYARYIAKNLVAANVADEITIQLSYGIGMAEPISINVQGKMNHGVSEELICELISEVFHPTPYNIINTLKLKDFHDYKKTAVYGHFGNNNYPWEKTDRVAQIKEWIDNKCIKVD